jgi:hypothetical protein
VNNPVPDAESLRRLLGKTVLYKAQRYRVIEVLDNEPSLVLESLDQTQIQSDLHGRAKRHSATHLTLRALDETQHGPSDDLMALRVLD